MQRYFKNRPRKYAKCLVTLLICFCLGGQYANAELLTKEKKLATQPLLFYSERADVQTFIGFMVERHNFDRQELLNLFSEVEIRQKTTKKMQKLTARKLQIPETWWSYRQRFVTEGRIQRGLVFANKYKKFLRKVSNIYKVPLKIIVATVGMETYYGFNTGRHNVFNSLVILAFDGKRRKSFYTHELESFLLLSRKSGYNPLAVKGSYSGAIGLAQFIPSSIMRYGVDGDADGEVDMLHNPYDALASIGRYYRACSWQQRKPVVKKVNKLPPSALKSSDKKKWLTLNAANGEPNYWRLYKNFSVLKCYNNSSFYALALYQLSEAIEKKALTSGLK